LADRNARKGDGLKATERGSEKVAGDIEVTGPCHCRPTAAAHRCVDGEPEAALLLFADAIAAFQQAGNVPQLIITLSSVPALFERLDRPAPAAMLLGALSREPSSAHHVPELADIRDRVSRALGKTRAADLIAEGAALDLGDRLFD